MKFRSKYSLPIFLLAIFACNDKNDASNDKALIFPKGEKITNDNFTGTAYLQMLVKNDSVNPTAVGNVTFEPGARTKWHSHPGDR